MAGPRRSLAAAVAPFRAWLSRPLHKDSSPITSTSWRATYEKRRTPPYLPVIETNRLTRLALATTNIFGVHTPRLCPPDTAGAVQDGEA